MAESTSPRLARGPTAWRFGVPLVCLLAGLLLAATHGVSGGDEIRRSDAPRLVDLVREAQQSVDRLTAQRDTLVTDADTHHGGSPEAARRWRRSRPATPGWPPTPAWTRSAAPVSSSRSPMPSATPTADSPATHPRTTWSCISRTSRPS